MSFHTTNDAIAMKAAAPAEGLTGRMVPIPRQISAGCGLAWSEPAGNEEALRRAIERLSLEYEAITSLML